MQEQEETPADEEAQAPEGTEEASAGEEAPDAQASAAEDAPDAQEGDAEEATPAPTPPAGDDPVIVAAQEHLDTVDMDEERAAVDKLTKGLDS